MRLTLREKALRVLLIIALSVPAFAEAQVVINEICPSNSTGLTNDDGDKDDWIELYNKNNSSVNLNGYGLSDDPTQLDKFIFPSTTIPAHGRMVIFASDRNKTELVDHWETAVNASTQWRYAVGSNSIDTNWRNLGFNESAWSQGQGGIGYGDGDDQTSVASGTRSVMMRKTFNVPDTSDIARIVFQMDYDDGFVAYLNGVEIARVNLGVAGVRPAWNELAPGTMEAKIYQGLQPDSFNLDMSFIRTILRQGNNVLAVEVHNQSTSSNDLTARPFLSFGLKSPGSTYGSLPSWFRVPPTDYYNADFKLSRTGETVYLTDGSRSVIDQQAYTNIELDNSWGRSSDGSGSWCLFGTPTPNASNSGSSCYSGYASIPIFSLSPGFYPSTRWLNLTTTTPGGQIRYTTNGDDPTTSSRLYSSSVLIDTTQTVRAKVFAPGMLPSQTITNSYFIDEDIDLPIWTITTDYDNLWDYNTGIYVMGPGASSSSPYFGANFWQDWEKPAAIEYWDKDKNRLLRFNADIEIYGNYSRAKPQKSFNIKLSDKYGTGEINLPMYSTKPWLDKTDDIVLRNSGTDWNKVHFRDAFMERGLKSTYSGYLAADPVVLFLNGEFWGVYTNHENHDGNWIGNNFGYKSDEIDYLKEDGSTMTIKEGSDTSFWALYNYATTQSPSTQAYYNYIDARLDLKAYADYFIAETYYNNGDWIGDWTNNIKLWRPREAGGKWRYLVYDLDFGCGLSGASPTENRLGMALNPSAFSNSSNMFDAITDNPTFKNYFINRYADLINTIFLEDSLDNIIQEYESEMSHDMQQHFQQWGSTNSDWQDYIDEAETFIRRRAAYARDQIESEFGLTSQVTLTLQVDPPGAGRIEISTITPATYPWSGVYFRGNNVTVTAIPNPGYTFDEFSSTTLGSHNHNQSANANFTSSQTITARFNGSSRTPDLDISEINFNSDSAYDAGDWVEIKNNGNYEIDLSGWSIRDAQDNHRYVFPTGTTIPANGYLVIAEDMEKFDAQHPSVANVIGPTGFNFSNSEDQIRLSDWRDDLVLMLYYQDVAPWPSGADGDGYTYERANFSGDPSDGNNWIVGCIGGSPGQAFVPLNTTVNFSGSTLLCTGQSTQLTVSASGTGNTYQWRRDGVILPGETNATITITDAGEYDVLVQRGGCTAVSDSVVITQHDRATDPVVAPIGSCDPGTFTLTATSNDYIRWYDAPGGNLLATGNTFTTPFISTTTTYYLVAGDTCPSNVVSATVAIGQAPAAPTVTDQFICGPTTLTLSATDTTGVIRWYSVASGGTPIATTPSFTTGLITTDTVFYAEAGPTCPSARVPLNISITTTSPPSTTSSQRCGTGTVNLSASAGNPISWYDAPTGGNLLATGSIFTTPVISSTTTYYAEANAGCPSVRVAADAEILPVPASPSTQSDTICGSGSLTLSATAGNTIYWFDVPAGGAALTTGGSYTTPVLNSTTTYYVETGAFCRSPRVPVNAVVLAVPVAPTTTSATQCGPGSLTLTASAAQTIHWYSVPVGGVELATGTSFTTPPIGVTTNYYVEAGDYCRSSRTLVQAVINPIPSPPSLTDAGRCDPGSVVLLASSPEAIYWFDQAVGGTQVGAGASYNTPSLSATTAFYVETGDICRSVRDTVYAFIETTPALPVATGDSRCGQGAVTLSATATADLHWFDVPSNGAELGTGSSFTTPVLTATTTFYVEAGNTCRSARVPVVATILTAPTTPVASDVNNCGDGSLTLTASSNGTMTWYDQPTGGTVVGTGGTFITPMLNTTTVYYVEASNGTCTSPRVPVQAIIETQPAVPVITDAIICGPGSAILLATSPVQVTWYDQATGGTALSTGSSFQTPVLSATTTYYAEAGVACRSNRVPATVTILTAAVVPVGQDASTCGAGSVVLSATSTDPMSWYDAAIGGNLLGSGASYTTPVITSSTTYYVEATNGACTSTRVPVQANVLAIPDPPIVADITRCGPGTVTLTAVSGSQVSWYNQASGGTLLGTGSTFTTPVLTTTTLYYAEAGVDCRSIRVDVSAVISTIAALPVVTPAGSCEPASLLLTASSSDPITWYDQASGGSVVGTGSSFQTPFLNSTTTYYAVAGVSCPSTAVPVDASIYTPTVISLGADTVTIQSGSTTVLDPGAGFADYSWSTTETTQTIEVGITGWYTVLVTDGNGCEATDSIFVNVITGILPVGGGVEALSVFPNPAHELLLVRWEKRQAGEVLIELCDGTGKLIRKFREEMSPGSQQVRFGMQDLAAGFYLLRISSDGDQQTVPVIRQ